MMKIKEKAWTWEVVTVVLVLLLVAAGILCPIYYEKKEKEAAIEKCQENYISILNMLNVYSGTNEMYEENNFSIRREILCLDENALDVEMINPETGEANVGFMHSVKEDDFYIYDDYLRMLLRAYYFYCGEEFIYTYDEIMALNGNCTEDEAAQLGGLARIYDEVKDNYLEKVSNAYDKYLEVNGEKYAGKEKYQLNYEDCLALEEYFEEEPEPEETSEE